MAGQYTQRDATNNSALGRAEVFLTFPPPAVAMTLVDREACLARTLYIVPERERLNLDRLVQFAAALIPAACL